MEVPALDSLSEREQRVLATLAVLHEPVGEKALLDWLKLLPASGTVAFADVEELGPVLAKLRASGLITSFGAHHAPKYAASTEAAHRSVEALHASEQLESWLPVVTRRAPRVDPETRWLHRSRLVRDIVLLAHVGDAQGVRAALADLNAPDARAEDPAQLLFDALGLTPPAPALRGLLPAERDSYALRALAESLDTLTPIGDALEQLLLAEAPQLAEALRAALAFYEVLRTGTLSPALAAALHQAPDPELLAMRAFVAWSTGRSHAEARALCHEAMEQSRGALGRKKAAVPGHAGPWLTLLLLTEREPTALALAEAQLDAAERRAELFGHESAYAALHVLRTFLAQGSLPPVRGEAFDDFSEVEAAWERVLIWSLLISWSSATPPRGYAAALESCTARASAEGFTWLAAELGRARRPERGAGLAALYAQQEPWEQVISSLELAVNREALPASQETARIRFLLDVDRRGRHTIGARIERITPAGSSVGRAIGWKRLRDIAFNAEWVTAEDLRVLRHVRAPESGAGSSREYVIDDAAAAALVGHPRVFADEESSEPLEVVAGTPRLELHESLEGVRLRVVPPQASERRVVCLNEGSQRVRVFMLSDAQWAVASQCGGSGLALPLRARERLRDLGGAFARHFELSAHVKHEGSASEVPSDTRIHVQLVRSPGGFKVRIRVVPIPGGASYLPGEGPLEVLAINVRSNGPRAERTERDLEDERARAAAVIAACPSLGSTLQSGHDFQLTELPTCLELLNELALLGDQVVLQWPEGQPLSVVSERDLSDLHLTLKQASYWLSAEGELSVDAGLKLSLKQLLDGIARAEGRFLPLSEGRFLALTQRLKRELDDLALLSQQRDGNVELHPLALGVIDRWEAEAAAQVTLEGRAALSLARLREAARLEVAPPAALAAELRPYQLEGFTWLSRLAHMNAGACLADDMGLGKTLQALALLVSHAEAGPALVVAPTSVIGNWAEEAGRFAPTLRVVRFAGDAREKLVAELGPGDLLVCSYGMLQQGIELIEQREFSVIVLDEAQAIKNPSTQRAKMALRLRGQMRVALTGTPVENHLGELWSIMSYLNPGLLGTSRGFEQRFVRPIQRDDDVFLAENLRRVVHPFILRRKKSDVLAELPEKTVVTLRITPSPDERALYAALREQALSRLRDPGRPGEVRLRMLAELMRMRRAACHPSLVVPETHITSSKLEAFEELVLELREEGHRALVFSQFVDHLSIVRERLDSLNVPYQYLDGSTSPSQRSERVRAFQAGEGDVFLISLRAGGFGLNLTGADYVIHLDPWWNPAVEDQASDRAHRIGQTRPVTIYRLVMEGSIEEKILALHDEKRELADRLLEGSDTGATLSVDTLASLIREVGGPLDASARSYSGTSHAEER